MAAGMQLSTVESTRAWLQATEQQRAEEQAQLRAIITSHVLSDFRTRVQWGLSLQGAADEVWRLRAKGKPPEVQEIISEALEGIGWVRPGRGRRG